MKKIISLSIIFSILILNNLLFSGNVPSCDHENKPDCNFVAKRLSKKFTLDDLKELCKNHSEKAVHLYNMALENLTDLEEKLPKEVFEKVQFFRDYTFMSLKQDTLYNKSAYKIANRNLDILPNNEQRLIRTFRSIAFHIKTNGCYDPKLAKFLIKIHLDNDYSPSKMKLNKYLCTAALLGDSMAVSLLLSIGANPNFVNKCENFYTPLAYALIQEHRYSKIKNKSFDQSLLIKCYELIAAMLMKRGARADLNIMNGVSGNSLNKTYIFMQTSNVSIFKLFENQIANKVEAHDEFGCNIVMNAFKLGNAKFIKYLYANPLYRNSQKARSLYTLGGIEHRSFMNLALEYYKHYDFKELLEFLIKNNEVEKLENNLMGFGFDCMWHAIADFDYECIKSLIQSGIPLNALYDDNSTNLIWMIRKASQSDDKKNLIKIIELFAPFGQRFFEHADLCGKTVLDYARKKDETESRKRFHKVMKHNPFYRTKQQYRTN